MYRGELPTRRAQIRRQDCVATQCGAGRLKGLERLPLEIPKGNDGNGKRAAFLIAIDPAAEALAASRKFPRDDGGRVCEC